MKKLFFVLLLACSLSTYAQFPGEDVQLLMGTTVKPQEKAEILQKYGYNNFYRKFNVEDGTLEHFSKKYRAFPINSSSSKYDELVNKLFKVTNIYKITGRSANKYMLELTNDKIGVLYYEYDTLNDAIFELDIVSGMKLPEGFYCKDVDVKDKGDKIVKIAGPVSGMNIIYIDYKNGKITCGIKMRTIGKEYNKEAIGANLYLANNITISRPNDEVKIEIGDYGNYLYNVTIVLTDEEMDLITKNKPLRSQVSNYDSDIDDESATKIMEYFKCIMEK